jgi:hypothetical protein
MKRAAPGLHPLRLLRLMEESIARCRLNLETLTVVTEAATGAYVVTPLLAAMAGADQVFAISRDSRFGSAEEAATETHDLARKAGVERCIEVIPCATKEVIGKAHIITNSGHVRPIDAQKIGSMRSGAVVPLMYENWELRSSDIDLDSCRKHGIRVAGTNEQHPDINVFGFLGPMAAKLLLDAGLPLLGCRILLVCDNEFYSYIAAGLRAGGADLITYLPATGRLRLDAVLIATTPAERPALTSQEIVRIAHDSPGAVVLQFFGTLDRHVIREAGLPIWPEEEPQAGHMGILPSAVGPEPIVRLQTGGLKVGEVLCRGSFEGGSALSDFAQPLLT